MTEGHSICDACSRGTHASLRGRSECTPCPSGFTTDAEGAATLDRCICEKGFFLQSLSNETGRCGRCMWGFTTTGVGATSKDDCSVNSLHAFLALTLVLLGFPPLVGYLIHRHHKRRKANEALMRNLVAGFQSIDTLHFPMCVVSSQWFCQLDEAGIAELHEGARKGGHILYLDSACEIHMFKEPGKKILFFSYHWLSWSQSGPNLLQLECMQAAAKETCRQNNLELSDLYIWLDVLSIPQRNDVCKKLAIDSLYSYASSADFLVAICPESQHEQTAEVAGVDSYKSRVWCRVEQMAHCCCNGFRKMAYSVEPGKLVPMDEEWLRSVMYIFEGQMTCCRLKHVGMQQCDQELLVPTMLAMYALMLDDGPGADMDICRMVEADRDRVFPHNFVFVTEKGKQVQRQLFGPLISLIRDYVATVEGREVLATLSARSGDQVFSSSQSEPGRSSGDDDVHQATDLTPSQAIGNALMTGRASTTDTAGGFTTSASIGSHDGSHKMARSSASLARSGTWNSVSFAGLTSQAASRRRFSAMLSRSRTRSSLSVAEATAQVTSRRSSLYNTAGAEAQDGHAHVLRSGASNVADLVYPVKLSI
eukprot:TRINITY_DN13229_c0_g1_i1.p1 TRINITY_DN13229_c0_g1~~TRINITY_DN13229_c0_g1_i1.p1  ORF type:complete len:684 (-),score=57.40 TRINITY_DN13229_c0_g1_i1:338-2116(-)